MKKSLCQLAAYNLWANNEMVKCLEQLSQEQLHSPIKSSFNSVYKTILHIWDAEYIWIQRLQGFSIKEWPSKNIDNDGFSTTLFLNNSANFNDYVNAQNSDFFDKECMYSNLKGEQFTNLNSEVVMHCLNHSTYHRGQLVTMFRQLELTIIPSTDFITFLRA